MSLATETVVPTKSYSYDETPYESYPFPQSHPNRLATMAKLFGMNAQDIQNCRVLELGAASGGNLIPMAFTLPGSQFVGIELSEKQVAEGKKTIEGVGLKNVEIKHMNIMDVNKETVGTFDYIIAHGVYSWVPNEVQEKILQICQDCLNPNGIAYISYNTYPGWHYRGMIRDMMLYHTNQFQDPAMKAAQARAVLDFLNQSVPVENNAYGIMLRNELELLRRQKDYYLLHDYLEEANTPVYFHQFIEAANTKGLQYLGEADFSTMLTSNFGKDVADTLKRISNDIVKTEQYMDFVRNRTFRQTLLCRNDVQLNRNLTPQSINGLYISSAAKPENSTFDPNMMQEKFSLPDGKSITSGHPLIRAAFHHLAEISPQAIKFEDLLAHARSKVSQSRIQDSNSFELEAQVLAGDLLNCYTVELVHFHAYEFPFTQELGDKPKVSELARYQAENYQFITNQLHGTTPIDIFAARLLKLCDGTRNRNDILTQLVELAKKGDLVVQKEGKLVTDNTQLRELLNVAMDERLTLLPKAAILVD